MRNSRTIVWLVVAIALLVGANVLVSRYGGDRRQIVRRTTLADLPVDVRRIQLVRPAAPLTVLTKTARWRLVEPYSGSVDEQAVMRLLDALTQTPVEDGISDADLLRLGRTRGDFALEDPVLSVVLGEGLHASRISFGAVTPSGTGVYAAVEGVDMVFTVPTNLLACVDLSADRLRRRSLFLVGDESVSAFDVKRSSGTLLAFTRDGDRWKVGGEQAAAAKVRQFLSAVVTSEAVGFVWPVGATNESDIVSTSLLAAYGLDPESAVTVTLKCQDGTDRQISFGKAADDRLVYALAQNSGAIVTVDAKLKELAQRDAVMYTDARLFPFEPAAIASFSVVDGDASYVVARGEAGWRLDSPVSAPADAETADALLDRVLALSSADLSSEGLKVSVVTNVAPIAVSRQSLLGDRRLEELRAKDVIKVDPQAIRRIVQTFGVGESNRQTSVVFSRERNAWNVETAAAGATVRTEGVESVLAAVSQLRAVRVERLKVSAGDLVRYGLENPFLTVAIDQERADSVRRNLLLGNGVDGGRYATVGSSDAVFVLDAESVRRLSAKMAE